MSSSIPPAPQTPLAHAKRPRSILAGPYGHPFHPILITIPIGTWSASLIFDIIGFFAEDPTAFTIGAQVLILIGLLGAAAAIVTGLMDYSVIAAGTAARRTALIHAVLNITVTLLFVVNLAIRWFGDHDEVNVLAFVLSVVAIGALGLSGYLGGKLAYHYGIRVADETTQAEGFVRPLEADQATRR